MSGSRASDGAGSLWPDAGGGLWRASSSLSRNLAPPGPDLRERDQGFRVRDRDQKPERPASRVTLTAPARGRSDGGEWSGLTGSAAT